MINKDQTIPCPVCQTKIAFDTKELMMGVQFSCSQCGAAVGLASESKSVVNETMDRLDEIKGTK